MHCICIIVVSLLSFTVLSAQHDTIRLRAEALLTTVIAENNCAGIAAGISTDGITRWQAGAGMADREAAVPFTPTTISRTASISKPMTAVAMMQLQEQGKLNLDDPVGKYLPAFAAGDKATITIRHLLQHASGIRAYANGKEQSNQVPYPSLEAATGIFLNDDLRFTPGTDFYYTTYGYTVLGQLIEAVTGTPYETYLRSHVWEPAGMTRTSVEKAGQQCPGKAALYHQKKPGKVKAVAATDLSDRIPGGGIQSTTEDLLKFGEALLQSSILEQNSLEAMITNSGLKQEGNPYGLGWYLYGKTPERNEIFGHNGAQRGTSAILLIIPQRKTVIVVLTNTSGALDQAWSVASGLIPVAAAWWED